MTNLITLTIPNDDHIALRAFGKALEEMALAHGAPLRVNPHVTVEKLREAMNNAEPTCFIPETDTTSQQVESKDDYRKWYEEAIEASNEAGYTCMSAADVIKNMAGYISTLENYGSAMYKKAESYSIDTTTQQVESLSVPVEANGATYETDLGSDNPQPVPVVDSTGTPWDERIHPASKALNADGTWRLRRKPKDMDEAEWATLIESVREELAHAMESFDEQVIMEEDSQQRALYAPENYVHMYRAADNIYALAKSDAELAEFEADGYVRHTQEQYDAWEGPNTADEGDDFHTDAGVVTEQTVAGIPPLPVPPPVVVPPITDWTFPKLMTFLTERQGKINVATVNMLLARDGIASLPELNAHPDKIGPFVARVKKHLGE